MSICVTSDPSMNESVLFERACDFLDPWGFEAWSWRGMAGVHRRVTFTKDSLLGAVATYYADDYIVWVHRAGQDAKLVYDNWSPERDVMTHRFLFVGNGSPGRARRRSFLFGLRGFLEIYPYRLGDKPDRNVRDLAHLANLGWELAQNGGRKVTD